MKALLNMILWFHKGRMPHMSRVRHDSGGMLFVLVFWELSIQ